MPSIASPAHRVPLEIWRTIFRICLGSELADTEPEGVLAEYQRLLASFVFITGDYRKKESIRGRLSLVCRFWRDALVDMDDMIVVTGRQRWIWPPGRNIDRANRVIYVTETLSILFIDDYYRAPRSKKPYTIDPSQLHGSIVQLDGVMLGSKKVAEPSQSNDVAIKALSSDSCERFNLQALWHTRFQNLVALKISSGYPFHAPDHLSPLSLPSLRCLLLCVASNQSEGNQNGRLCKWTFPGLVAFQLGTLDVIPRLKDDLIHFLRVHAETIEELVFTDRVSLPPDMDKILPRLRLYEYHDTRRRTSVNPLVTRARQRGADRA
ncbi:hypothetical protein PIIN_08682 [Serendipita indica DSM 11827]|uniref:F-box domain-containing protein n=1 Tax=Serendipita indica (strain DSM 11827) TaxID=1109443 RepID=G4TTS9_SERID|nr:hypothetical protein PIIN_08682 [Serendipita indica DSM 11827]